MLDGVLVFIMTSLQLVRVCFGFESRHFSQVAEAACRPKALLIFVSSPTKWNPICEGDDVRSADRECEVAGQKSIRRGKSHPERVRRL